MRTKWTLLFLALIGFAVSAQEPAGDRFYKAIRNDDLAALRALVKTHGTAVADRRVRRR